MPTLHWGMIFTSVNSVSVEVDWYVTKPRVAGVAKSINTEIDSTEGLSRLMKMIL